MRNTTVSRTFFSTFCCLFKEKSTSGVRIYDLFWWSLFLQCTVVNFFWDFLHMCEPPSQSLPVHLCWSLIGTDSCILRDRNTISVKNSSFCLSANAVGNLTKLLNMSMDANKTYVSPSEEYFKWVSVCDSAASIKARGLEKYLPLKGFAATKPFKGRYFYIKRNKKILKQ